MTAVDPRVAKALGTQLDRWSGALDGGARRVGWKIGLNIPEVQARLGLEEPVIGHLTSATQVEPGGAYAAGDAVALMAEPEVALELAREVSSDAGREEAGQAIGGYAPAIELVDVGRPPADLESIVAENVFHRAFALGSPHPDPPDGARVTVSVGGEQRAESVVEEDFPTTVRLVARLLGSVGKRLEEGDWIIAGSLTDQVRVAPGDELTIELGPLGRLAVSVS